MSLSRPVTTATLAAALLGIAACSSGPADSVTEPVEAPNPVATHRHGGTQPAEVHAWLGALRGAIAPFHRIERANDALWPDQITGCMVDEEGGRGGMGFHYGDMDRIMDGVIEELAPELLVYEPQKNGRMRLVAVEYAVPITPANTSIPPVLHGVPFHRNDVFGLWVLHAWIFEHNPAGILEDWNPRITCDHASAAL